MHHATSLRRTIAAVLAAVLGFATFSSLAAPAGAEETAATTVTKTPWILTETDPNDHKLSWNAFRMKGSVSEVGADGIAVPYAKGKVMVQKKACGKCKWKTIKKIKTNDSGAYRTRIFASTTDTWRWRVRVKGDETHKATKGRSWALIFR